MMQVTMSQPSKVLAATKVNGIDDSLGKAGLAIRVSRA